MRTVCVPPKRCGSNSGRRSKRSRSFLALRIRSSRKLRDASFLGSNACKYQFALAFELVRLDDPARRLLLAFLHVLDLDQAPVPDRVAERADEILLGPRDVGLGRLGELELAERLLELAADSLEARVGVGRDHRADELQREPDRARLGGVSEAARGTCRRRLLVDVDVVAAKLRVDGVATAAEVDEVEQREMFLERLGRDVEALHEPGQDLGLVTSPQASSR